VKRAAAVAVALAAIAAAVAVAATTRLRGSEIACGAGFVVAGWRCCDTSAAEGGACARSTPPAGHVVHVPATRLFLGPSDWEAEGRVAPRELRVVAFDIEAYEAHEESGADRARALHGLSFAEAEAYCHERGERLPTEDEWIAAAAGPSAHRYPWGDTGAVCRRGAWGLTTGPCARAADGPDSVGAHPDGATALGIQDLAGNVAEWTTREHAPPVAHGGSWASALATELRTWSRLEVDPTSHDARVGVRCARDANPVDSSVP
jgi:formylglycine-generating enzyme required for sulfatase activity